MYQFKNLYYLSVMLMTIFLVGCFQGEQALQEIDLPPDQDNSNFEDNVELTTNSYETITRELFLKDVNGFIVGQTFELPLPISGAVAEQSLEYLIKGGPITELLPNGFSAVIPEDTEILGLNLQKNGTLIIDLSEEFTNYQPEDEIKILEAMTFTLTQFDNIEQIKIKINGTMLDDMPVNGTPIAQGYSRSRGINVVQTDTIDLFDSKVVTIHYPTNYNHNRYYVPVTVYINSASNTYENVVKMLIEGPQLNNFSTLDIFDPKTTLVNKPRVYDGVLQLEFNEFILDDIGQGIISDEVIETLVRTLMEFPEVKAIQVNVNNVETIMNEQGEIYDQPVEMDSDSLSEKM